jgi:hypothetical protein
MVTSQRRAAGPAASQATGGPASCEVLLAEYANLKSEQRGRIGTRDNLLYTTLAAYAGVVTVTVSGHRVAYLLLAVPVALILGWTYTTNDTMITAIGQYVCDDLGPRVGALADVASPFGWEAGHVRDPLRMLRKAGQLAVDLLTFAVPPAAAVVWYWITGPSGAALLAVSGCEAASLLALTAWITRTSGLWRKRF